MSAIESVAGKIDVELLMSAYNLDYVDSGDQIRLACPMHGGKNHNSFVMDKEKGIYYCHSCGVSGDVFNFVMAMEDKPFTYAIKMISKLFNLQINEEETKKELKKHEKEFTKWKKLIRKEMEEFEEFHFEEVEHKTIEEYASFKKETLDYFEVTLVPRVQLTSRSGSTYHLNNYLSFPIRYEGKNVGYALRATDSSVPKWSLQPRHIHFGGMLFNLDRVTNEDEFIVLVEGIKDVMAWHEVAITAVCVFGSHITIPQYELIIKSGKDVVLCFDGDDAGRKATSSAVKMLKNKCRIYKVHMNEGEDAESIPRKELIERWKEKKLI